MSVLLYGTVIFLISFFVHLVIWRIHLPKRQPRAILFIGTVVLGLALLGLALGLGKALPLLPRDLFEYVCIALFDLSCLLSYAISYTAIEAESPTSLMVLALEKAGPHGLRREDFDRVVTDELFVENRMEGLEASNLVTRIGTRYRLNEKGQTFLQFFLLPRRWLGASESGG